MSKTSLTCDWDDWEKETRSVAGKGIYHIAGAKNSYLRPQVITRLTDDLQDFHNMVCNVDRNYLIRCTPSERVGHPGHSGVIRNGDLMLEVWIGSPNVTVYKDLASSTPNADVSLGVNAALTRSDELSADDRERAREWGVDVTHDLMKRLAGGIGHGLLSKAININDAQYAVRSKDLIEHVIKGWRERHDRWVMYDEFGPDYTHQITKHVDIKEATPVKPQRQLLPNQGAW